MLQWSKKCLGNLLALSFSPHFSDILYGDTFSLTQLKKHWMYMYLIHQVTTSRWCMTLPLSSFCAQAVFIHFPCCIRQTIPYTCGDMSRYVSSLYTFCIREKWKSILSCRWGITNTNPIFQRWDATLLKDMVPLPLT